MKTKIKEEKDGKITISIPCIEYKDKEFGSKEEISVQYNINTQRIAELKEKITELETTNMALNQAL